LRVLSDWINAAIGGRQIVALGLIDERYATIQAEANGGTVMVAERSGLAEAGEHFGRAAGGSA
jgi:hypothetical protein